MKFKPVNQSLGKHLSFASFSGKQTVVLASVFILTFFLTSLLGVSIYTAITCSLWLSLTCALLSGSNPYRYWSKIYPFGVPYWVKGYLPYSLFLPDSQSFASVFSKNKIGSKKVQVQRNQGKTLNPMEDWLDLITLGRMQKDGLNIGFYVLGASKPPPNQSVNRKSKSGTIDLSKIVIKFVFNCQGITPLQREDGSFETINNRLTAGFKDIDTTFTFRWSSFCSSTNVFTDSNEQGSNDRHCLKNRVNNPISLESQYLDSSILAREQELIEDKKLSNTALTVETSFTPYRQTNKKDFLDRMIETFLTFWQRKIAGKSQELDQCILADYLNQASSAYLRHKQILEEMGLEPKACTDNQIWRQMLGRVDCSYLYSNKEKNLPLTPPYILVFDGFKIWQEVAGQTVGVSREVKTVNNHAVSNHSNPDSKGKEGKKSKSVTPLSLIANQIHVTTRLLDHQVPFADRRWVTVGSGKLKYIAVLVLNDKPYGFLGDKGQVRYLWEICTRIYDIEIISEISPANSDLVRLSQQLLTKRGISQDAQALQRGTVEVSARINTDRSVEAQTKLYTGDMPFNTSFVILVYRDSLKELDQACHYLSLLFQLPARLERELEYAWLIWLQTLGLRKEPLLSTPYYRGLLFFASELSGLCNLVQNSKADKQGLKLIAKEGNTPVYIDLSTHKNILVLGTTGAGKSVLLAYMLSTYLALGTPCIIIDLPGSDGKGSFSDFSLFFGGIYFDISKESNNVLQLPALDFIRNKEERERRRQEYINDVILIVTRLILGNGNLDSFLTETIESLIPLGIKAFYDDAAIQDRFIKAKKEGLGSKAWDNTPTLQDLVPFYSVKYLNLDTDDNQQKALNHIQLRLNYWLNSAIAHTIARPSTFDLSNKYQLITFALTNLQSDKEGEIFALSASLVAKRQALSSLNSVFCIDEASVLMRYPSFSLSTGRLCATGRKSGCTTILAGQDLESIAQSVAGSQIIENISCRLIGKIVAGASKNYQEYLQIPQHIIEQNESFNSSKSQGCTQWLLDYQNSYTQCLYYPSYPLLALTANNREEQLMRDKFKAKYPDKFDWLTHYYRYYKQNLK